MILKKNKYRSKISSFLDELKEDIPDLEKKQRNGRGELWDKPIENDRKTNQLKKYKKIRQKSYVYFDNNQ
jgi:hypothetical protein